jgi:glycosyltransferase involved in cell wall biosynthesis
VEASALHIEKEHGLTMPRVSVIIANHNGGAFLVPAVRSILAQNYRDFDVIAIDDGSSDSSVSVLNDMASRDAKLKVVARANKGLTPSLNDLARMVDAPLIARMDADDIALPDRLEKQVRFFDANPNYVLLGSAYEFIDELGRRFHVMRPPVDNPTLQQHCLSGRTPICHPTAMFRRDAFERAGGYDESYRVAQDLDLWLRLGEIGPMACVPDVLLQYRMHVGSVSEKRQQEQIESMRRACESAWARRGIEGIFQGDAGWRALDADDARFEQTLRYGWWAWQLGERRTAVAYGWRAVKAKPRKKDGWKLLACAAIKPPPSDSNYVARV